MLTKQQLLIPRVLCVGGKDGELIWPWSTLRAGQILKSQIEEGDVSYKFLDPIENDYRFLNQMGIENFPHLFRPLPWWYGRKVEEMPLYLSSIALYKDFHVVKVSNNYATFFIGTKDGQYWEAPYDEYQPADESDYQEYQKQKQ